MIFIFILISNDKFASLLHTVLTKTVGPRISVTCFYRGQFQNSTRLYGPIKDLVSEEIPPVTCLQVNNHK